VRELKPLMPLIETTKILPEYGQSDLDRIITARIDWQKLLPPDKLRYTAHKRYNIRV
jgi:hypothetical protein